MNWKFICENQHMTINFIKKHKYYINWERLFEKNKFIRNYPDYCTLYETYYFTYIANDGFLDSEEPPATVNITIDPVNDNPVLDFIDNFDFDEDESETITVSANDVDDDPLTYSCTPQGLNIFCDVDNDQITFTSFQDYFGTETVTIIVDDGNGGQDSQEDIEVTVNSVNDPPVVEDINT